MLTPKRPRGRPSTPKLEFIQRRDSWLEALQSHWSKLGWELMNAKTLHDIQLAFAGFSYPSLNFELLSFPAPQESTDSARKSQRRRVRAGIERLRDLNDEYSKAQEDARWASQAIQGQKQSKLYREFLRRQSKEQSMSKRLEAARELQREEELLLTKQDAFFAQKEVLRLIKERRYSLSPTSVAGALADLPRIGYRQGLKKSTANRSRYGTNLAYDIFVCVRSICRTLEQVERKSFAGKFKKRLRLMKRPQSGVKQLRENWYYLRLAIERALVTCTRTARLPFVITSLYFERSQVRSAEDQIRSELEKLV
jgi:hypothetical protein